MHWHLQIRPQVLWLVAGGLLAAAAVLVLAPRALLAERSYLSLGGCGPVENRQLRARVLGQRAGEMQAEIVEFPDQAPSGLDEGQPASFWTVWPVEASALEGFLYRALHYSTVVASPNGTFCLEVLAFTVARGPSGADRLVARFSYDPWATRPLQSLMPELVEAARTRGLLTEAQLDHLGRRQAAYERRFEEFLTAWERFRQSPRDPALKAQTFAALVAVNGSARDLAPSDLRPQEFFVADQRVALREAGYKVPGDIRQEFGRAGRYTIVVRDCPVSELVEAWNDGRTALAFDSRSLARPRLKADPSNAHHEVSLTIALEMADTPESTRDKVLARLLLVEGILPVEVLY